MKFIRAYWGNLENFGGRHKIEIRRASKNKKLNEVVFVWGNENCDYLKSLGFDIIKMSDKSSEYGEDYFINSDTFLLHKLVAVREGCKKYGEVVFLDWDCRQIKDIDDNFYLKLREQDNEIQMPAYSFPKKYKSLLQTMYNPKDINWDYIDRQLEYLEKFHYEWDDSYVTPNASFIYCTNPKVMDDLIKINDELKIGIVCDEMTFNEYSKKLCKDLEGYIKRFEPLVCNAKREDHFNQGRLNQYISKFIKKDLYFIHE